MQRSNSGQNKFAEVLGWTILGIAVGIGFTIAAKSQKDSGKSPLTTLEDLFSVCEKDCQLLETQLNHGQIAS